MIQLRREFLEGPDRAELVLLHYAASPQGPGGRAIRSSLVMPSPGNGRREVSLFLPDTPAGGRYGVRYAFSAIRAGAEWYSPPFEIEVPGREPAAAGTAEDNPGPAPGRGCFRLALPLRPDEPRSGTVHYGFGAMRKKPSRSLCRATVPVAEARPAIAEVPEALAVLKNRPMPFFLYHYVEGGPALSADKIAPVRVALSDEAGDIVCARLLWSEESWAAPNITAMEAKGFPPGDGKAADDFFAPGREAYLSARARALEALPLPRTFEAFVFGVSGTVVEYCFQVLRRTPGGAVAAGWRNRGGGGNWRVTV